MQTHGGNRFAANRLILETENKEYIVPEGTRKTRADKLLSGAFDEHSRSDFERAFEAELVLVKGCVLGIRRRLRNKRFG